jgi:hypothetical protein
MTLSITHTTPADGTFSTTGAAAWDATHSLGGVADISQGGTNATTAGAARTNLGLGTIATQDANAVAITGGTINGATVGATTVAAGSFSTLNSSGATRLGGLSGNQSLQVNNVASAVNYAQIVGAVTGGSPVFSAQGTDSNVSFIFTPKGTGGLSIGTAPIAVILQTDVASGNNEFRQSVAGTTRGQIISSTTLQYFVNGGSGNQLFYISGATQVAISPTASAVNYLNFTGAATGAAPTISAAGSDTNIGLVLTGKGTGVVALGGTTAANSGVQVVPTTSAVNYLTLTGGPTGNGGNIAVGGTDTNANLVLKSKGSFNITLQTSNGAKMADFAPSSTGFGVNGLLLTAAGTGNPPELSASGSDTNINLKLTPKGTGTVQYGTYTAGVVAQAGYITITDAGGTSRRLLVG